MSLKSSNFTKGEVIENKAWTDQLYSLKIRTEQLPFKAGQFVRLQLPVDGELLAKPYSLINATDETDLEILFNTVPNGRFSNILAKLTEGDRIEVSQPAYGFFVLDEIPEAKHLWLFATGTGIGPYLSMLKTSEIWERFEKIILIHGVKKIDELVYSDQIMSWMDEYPEQFQYLSCVSREENISGFSGRMTDILGDGSLEKYTNLKIAPELSHIMLCGNRNMIKDMKKIMDTRGLKKHFRHERGHISTEHYF